MQEVKFTLRTLTPLFLAGADQATAELRAPTFRGLIRYWQRALVGGLVGTSARGLEQVMKSEADIFGATDVGSAVSIKVSAASKQPEEFTERTSINVGGKWQATGKGYLLWTMVQSGRVDRGNFKPARWYFPKDTQFHVSILARDQDYTKLTQAIAAFWLLIQLGGVGSRSRRCAGSLAIVSTGSNTKELFSAPTIDTDLFGLQATAQKLKGQIEAGIQAARALYSHIHHSTSIGTAQFDILAKGTCHIWILQGKQVWRSAEDAMSAIGESLQDYRSTIIPPHLRKIFGLPLKGVSGARRASPLLLRVTQLQGGQFVGIAVLFKTSGKEISMSDYGIIEQWIAKDFPTALEVSL